MLPPVNSRGVAAAMSPSTPASFSEVVSFWMTSSGLITCTAHANHSRRYYRLSWSAVGVAVGAAMGSTSPPCSKRAPGTIEKKPMSVRTRASAAAEFSKNAIKYNGCKEQFLLPKGFLLRAARFLSARRVTLYHGIVGMDFDNPEKVHNICQLR